MERLSLVLWRERELMETLLFKLEQESLVLASGSTHWLMRSAREVEAVLEQLRQTAIVRAAAADVAAVAAGIDVNPSLRELAGPCEEPWQWILLEHHDAFEQLTRRIGESTDHHRTLTASGLHSEHEALYGDADDPARRSRMIQPSLVEFLR